MSWFSDAAATYDAQVVDAESGETATVTLKRLNAGEHAKVVDVMFADDDEGSEGRTRLVLVQSVVVSWTIPGPPPTPDTIAALHPEIVMQIYVQIDPRDVNPFAAAVAARASLATEKTDTQTTDAPAPAAAADADAD